MNSSNAKAIKKASELLGNTKSQYRKTKAFYSSLSAPERELFMQQTKEFIKGSQ